MGVFQWGFVPFAEKTWGDSLADQLGQYGGHVSAVDFSDKQRELLQVLVLCEGFAMLIFLYFLFFKRNVIHLGIRPTGGDHGKINPYGTASPFFVVFKPLKDQPEDELMATILAQRKKVRAPVALSRRSDSWPS